MANSHGKTFQTITVGILTAILTGLIIFLIKFFAQTFPDVDARIRLLEQKSKSHDNTLEKIDDRTQKIYEILIERKNERY